VVYYNQDRGHEAPGRRAMKMRKYVLPATFGRAAEEEANRIATLYSAPDYSILHVCHKDTDYIAVDDASGDYRLYQVSDFQDAEQAIRDIARDWEFVPEQYEDPEAAKEAAIQEILDVLRSLY